jgi:type II secretory pathway pseudopilin PulG
MRKIKAFTITEIVVAMVVSAIVISIAILAYLVVSKQFTQYKALNDELLKVYEVNYLVQQDSFEANAMEFILEENSLTFTGQNQCIQYEILNDKLVRLEMGRVDTIEVAIDVIPLINQPDNVFGNNDTFLSLSLKVGPLEYLRSVKNRFDSKGLIK